MYHRNMSGKLKKVVMFIEPHSPHKSLSDHTEKGVIIIFETSISIVRLAFMAGQSGMSSIKIY